MRIPNTQIVQQTLKCLHVNLYLWLAFQRTCLIDRVECKKCDQGVVYHGSCLRNKPQSQLFPCQYLCFIKRLVIFCLTFIFGYAEVDRAKVHILPDLFESLEKAHVLFIVIVVVICLKDLLMEIEGVI